MRNSPLQTYYLQWSLEVFLCVCFIGGLLALAAHAYRKTIQKAEVLAHVASTDGALLQVRYYYALTGEWPQDEAELTSVVGLTSPLAGYRGSLLRIDHGAVQVPIVSGALIGSNVTLHPAVPALDKLGPVHWVAGPDVRDSGRTIIGPDRTTVLIDTLPRDSH
jgi:hypothetical protein